MLDHSLRLTPSDIDRAFEAGQFFLLFQPKVALASREVVGVEAFLRWRHPSFGLMPPGLFLGFIAQHNKMRELTEFVLTRAFHAARDLAAAKREWNVSVNLSPSDIGDPRLPTVVRTLSGISNLKHGSVTLEVPEYALPLSGEAAEENLRAMKANGARLALDSGPAPAGAPRKDWPEIFDELKIGGSVIIRFAHNVKGDAIANVMARLEQARAANVPSVAVGVEDEATLRAIAELGFTHAQGAFIQRAVTLKKLLEWDGNWQGGKAVDLALAEEGAATADATPSETPRSADELVARANESASLVHDDEEPKPEPVINADEAQVLETNLEFEDDDEIQTVPERPVVAPGELLQRRIKGLDKPIAMRVREPKKKGGWSLFQQQKPRVEPKG